MHEPVYIKFGEHWWPIPCWLYIIPFFSLFSEGERHFIKESVIFTTVSLLRVGDSLLSSCVPLCKDWRTHLKFVCLCKIQSYSAICNAVAISEFSLSRHPITNFMVASAFKWLVWLHHSASIADFIGISAYNIILYYIITIIYLLIYLLTAIGLSPGGSGYFTCIQNMKLVTNTFKSGGLLEKPVVATWNVGNRLSVCL